MSPSVRSISRPDSEENGQKVALLNAVADIVVESVWVEWVRFGRFSSRWVVSEGDREGAQILPIYLSMVSVELSSRNRRMIFEHDTIVEPVSCK